MDVPTLNTFLSPMFTVTTVWNTGETGDIYTFVCFANKFLSSLKSLFSNIFYLSSKMWIVNRHDFFQSFVNMTTLHSYFTLAISSKTRQIKTCLMTAVSHWDTCEYNLIVGWFFCMTVLNTIRTISFWRSRISLDSLLKGLFSKWNMHVERINSKWGTVA